MEQTCAPGLWVISTDSSLEIPNHLSLQVGAVDPESHCAVAFSVEGTKQYAMEHGVYLLQEVKGESQVEDIIYRGNEESLKRCGQYFPLVLYIFLFFKK